MKPLLTFFILTLTIFTSTAQKQERYIKYLDAALAAAEKKDSVKVIENLEYFSTAIEVDNITPERLDESVLNLYTKVLYEAIKSIVLPHNLSNKTIPFLMYGIEEKPNNMASIGVLYEFGYGVNQDYAVAIKWYEMAIEKGEPSSMNNLGMMYLKGKGIPQDYVKAKFWLEKAINYNHGLSASNLAHMYLHGLGVDRDINKAISLLEKGIQISNDFNTMNNLAHVYQHYGKVDYGLAKYWYEKASENGSSEAMTGLAMMYEDALGVEQDYNKAKMLHEKAAALGNTTAMVNLGYMYRVGLKDYSKAKYWYEVAAAKNNNPAMINLAYMYFEGLGVEKDKKMAKYWYLKACNNGDKDACNYLETIKP